METLQAIGRVAAAGALACLAGCAHGPLSGSRSAAVVSVERGYEGVYLALLQDARRCYPASGGARQREVTGTLDGPRRAGKVTFSFRSTAAQETFMTADIRSVGPTRTEVEIEVAPGWESHAKALRGWIDGTSSECA